MNLIACLTWKTKDGNCLITCFTNWIQSLANTNNSNNKKKWLVVFKWCLNKSNEHLPPDRINISIANIPHEFKILTQPLLSGLTGWKAGRKAGWLACYSAVMADDRGSQVKVKAHDWLFCFSCKNLLCFVTKHDLCYFLNTIFVWSKFSTDFHTKIKQILDELSSQAPPWSCWVCWDFEDKILAKTFLLLMQKSCLVTKKHDLCYLSGKRNQITIPIWFNWKNIKPIFFIRFKFYCSIPLNVRTYLT